MAPTAATAAGPLQTGPAEYHGYGVRPAIVAYDRFEDHHQPLQALLCFTQVVIYGVFQMAICVALTYSLNQAVGYQAEPAQHESGHCHNYTVMTVVVEATQCTW